MFIPESIKRETVLVTVLPLLLAKTLITVAKTRRHEINFDGLVKSPNNFKDG